MYDEIRVEHSLVTVKLIETAYPDKTIQSDDALVNADEGTIITYKDKALVKLSNL